MGLAADWGRRAGLARAVVAEWRPEGCRWLRRLGAGRGPLRSRAAVARRARVDRRRLAADSAWFERGLLPRPVLGRGAVVWSSWYRPRGGSLLLGGDFFDAVEQPDGTVRVVIGDVSGHGPGAAAVGLALRIAWRSLVLAGLRDELVLPQLQAVLESERRDPELFASLCDATVDPERRQLALRVAGHPPPLLLHPQIRVLHLDGLGPPLGVEDTATWPTMATALPPGWALLLYTDGIFEVHRSPGSAERWGVEGLQRTLQALAGRADRFGDLTDRLIEAAEEANGGLLADDVAVVLIAEPEGP